MSDTTRQEILNQIKTILEGVTSIKSVEINKTTPTDIETAPFPCAFIYSGNETKLNDNRAVIGYENWEWMIDLEFWLDERNDSETILGVVHTAMAADYTIGAHAVTSDRIGSEFFVLDPTRAKSALILHYSVIYRHRKGTP